MTHLNPFNQLPLELFQETFLYLDLRNILEISCVSRYWNRSITTIKEQVFYKIKKFVFGKKNSDLVNLTQLILSKKSYSEAVLSILNPLTKDDLKKLEEAMQQEPEQAFFKEEFNLARIYKEIDEAHQTPCPYKKAYALQNSAEDLTKTGHIKRAIKVANMINDEKIKGRSLQNIVLFLTKMGCVQKALDLTDTIIDKIRREVALKNISEIQAENNFFDTSINIASKITSKTIGGYAFQNISKILAKKGLMDMAIKVAHMITEKRIKEITLKKISDNHRIHPNKKMKTINP